MRFFRRRNVSRAEPAVHPLLAGAQEVLFRARSSEGERAGLDKREWEATVADAGPPLLLEGRRLVEAFLVPVNYCAQGYTGSADKRTLLSQAISVLGDYVAGHDPAQHETDRLGRLVEQVYFDARSSAEEALQEFLALMHAGTDSDAAAKEADAAAQSRRAALSVAQAMAVLGYSLWMEGSWVAADEQALEHLSRFAGQNAAESVLDTDERRAPELLADLLAVTHGYEPAPADEEPDAAPFDPKSVLDRLLGELSHPDPGVRHEAASELQELRDERAVPALIDSLRDDEWIVRMAAVQALAAIGDERAAEPLLALVLNENEHEDVRSFAAAPLGDFGDKRAVEPLTAMLADDDVWASTILAVGKLGDARSVDPLIRLLQHGRYHQRMTAAEALGAIGDDRAFEPLLAAMREWDDPQNSAAKAIGRLLRGRPLDPVVVMLREGEHRLRIDAVIALGASGDPRAVEPLASSVRDDESYFVRCDAAAALGNLGGNAAVQALVAALKDEEEQMMTLDGVPRPDRPRRYPVREAAARALERIEDPAAKQALADFRAGTADPG